MAYKVELQELTNGLGFLLCYGKKGYTHLFSYAMTRTLRGHMTGQHFQEFPAALVFGCAWLQQ